MALLRRAVVHLAGRRGPWLLALLGLLVAGPAVGLGLGVDDFVQRARLMGLPLPGIGLTHNVYLELFDFIPANDRARSTMRDLGFLPWWVHPEAQIAFPRPLSAATHVLDHRLWPDSLPLQHAHSLLWYAAAILVAALLFRRLCARPAVAALAALMFALSDTHVQPAAWLCNRNALVCFVLGGLAIHAHVRWRREGGAARLALALGAASVALLGGEAALGAFGYIAAYELWLERASLARRLLALVPYAALALGWQLAYRAFGYGTRGLGMYRDPGGDPLGYLAGVAERLPVLLLAQWGRVSADILMHLSRPVQLGWLAVALVIVALLIALLRRQLREEAEARFWATGMLLCLLPACAAYPMDRLLLFAGLGAFALLAGQTARLGWLGGEGPSAPAVGRGARFAVATLLVIHVIVAPLAFPVRLAGWHWMQRKSELAALAVPEAPSVAGESVIWVNGTDLGNVEMTTSRIVRGAPRPRAQHVLTSFQEGATIARPDARTLVIAPDGGFLTRPVDRLLRSLHPPFRRGEQVRTLDFTATVEAVSADGRPERVSFRFRASLEDPSFRWLCLADGFVARAFPLPRVGETVSLPAPRLF